MNKLLIYCIFISIGFSTSNCESNQKDITIINIDSDQWNKSSIPLKGKILFKESETIGMVKAAVLDSILVGIHSKLDTNICTYNVFTKKRIECIGLTGKGPGEFLGPYDFGIDPIRKKIWVLDATQKKLVEYNLSNLKVILSKEYNIENTGTTLAMRYYKNNQLLLHLFSSEGLLALYNFKNNSVFYLPNTIPNNPDGLPENIIDFENLSAIDILPDSNLVIRAYNYKDRIDIYNIKSGMTIRLLGPIQNPDYIIEQANGNPVFTHTEKTRSMYNSVVVVGNSIYALYNGKNQEEGADSYGKSNIIHVFDLTGQLLRNYKLDYNIVFLDYIPLSNSLFGIGDEGVISFNLDSKNKIK